MSNLQFVTIPSRKGPVDVVYELEIAGDHLHVKDLMVYSRQKDPITGVLHEMLNARTQLTHFARELGFATLRITGHRSLKSTSANPGKGIDIRVRLRK